MTRWRWAVAALLLWAGPAWATDNTILMPTGQLLDTEHLTVGSSGVERQRIQIGGSSASAIAVVTSSAANSGDFALATRNIPQGTQTVSGTVAATQSGTWTVQPGNTANTTAWLVTGTGGTFPATQSTSPWIIGTGVSSDCDTGAGTQTCYGVFLAIPGSGGAVVGGTSTDPINVTIPASGNNVCSGSTIRSANSTNATRCKASAGVIYGGLVTNLNAAVRYLGIFNDSASPPTCTNTPKVLVPIPGNTAVGGVALASAFTVDGIAFDTGIGICLFTTLGGTGSVATDELTLTLVYK